VRFGVVAALLAGCLAILMAPPGPALAGPPRELEEAREQLRRIDPAASAITLPKTPAGKQMRWVIDVLNGAPMENLDKRFSRYFLEDLPEAELKAELLRIREEGFHNKRVVPVKIEQQARDDYLSIIAGTKGGKGLLNVLVLTGEEGLIEGLRFTPTTMPGSARAEPGGEGGGSWEDFDQAMDDLKGEVAYGAYQLVPKDPAKPNEDLQLLTVAGKNEDRALAIGSAFKLYVLGALAEDVLAGKASWDEQLAIDDRLKSLPSGVMHLSPAGSVAPLREFAQKMIAISDNTATDHLLHRLGRERVEAFTNALNENAERNTPMLSTREMFALKLGDPALRESYLLADREDRRIMLGEGGVLHDARPDVSGIGRWQEPIEIDTLEWFASPREVGRILARLRELELREGAAQVGEVLRVNPGLSFDRDLWKSVAFKGGSEVGVIHCCWLLEREDGNWYVFSITWNDRAQPVANDRFMKVAYQGIEVLAKDPRNPKAPPPGDRRKGEPGDGQEDGPPKDPEKDPQAEPDDEQRPPMQVPYRRRS
jgi:hypothetical protein